MNKPDYWYPQPELLLLTYKSNNTKYHGLDHVLRVWLYANLISQNISEKHDNKVVSATALFHEYGRDSDRKNSEHIETANRWIDKTFPILWPDFDPYQRDMFKVCNNYHEITDQSGSPIEAEIINDANILDGRNIPLGKVNTDDLILLVSQDLVEISQNIYKRWQYHKSRGHNEFSTFRRILKDFPQLNIDLPKNLKKYLDEHEDRDWDLHFRSLEEIYTDLERRCVSFQNSLLRGENIIRSANEIEQILDLIEQINWQGDVTTQSLIFNSNQLTFRSIKIGLVDHGIHPSKRKIIKRLYNRSKKRRDSIIFEEISMKGIYKFIQSNGSKKYPNIQNSLLQYLSVRDHNIEILTYLIFSKDPESEYFCSALNDKYPINLTTMLKGMKSDQLERYSWLYINANDSLCEKSNGMIESEDTLIAEKILQNIIDRSVDMIYI